MISVEKAKELVLSKSLRLGADVVPLGKCRGRVLAGDVCSPIAMPPFQQSAMDGYAVRLADLVNLASSSPTPILEIVDEIPAGRQDRLELPAGTAMRIFTGAPVPDGADAVIKQEDTTCQGNLVQINIDSVGDIPVEKNIRMAGEELQVGDLALAKGTTLHSAGIGLLSGLGMTEVEVFRLPKVGILTTGDELAEAGSPLAHGQIYESHSATLTCALDALGFPQPRVAQLKDEYTSTVSTIGRQISEMDVLILTGGISVGDYDFVGKALNELGTKELFYKIKQKPGKPMYFGRNGNCLIFALPGNPASMLTCFLEYVVPSLFRLKGEATLFPIITTLPLASSYVKKGPRAQFLRGKITDGQVHILDGQSSFMMHAFAHADCLIYLPETVANVRSGENVEVHHIPF